MADNTSIEWTRGDDGTPGTTWNPILGCSKVSPGCDRCYAIIQARIRESNPSPKVAAAFAGLTERTEDGIDWTGRVNLLPDRLMQPLKWRKPRRVFVNSLADLFHERVPDEFIAQVFAVMAITPRHTYQLLSKRHGRMRSLLNSAGWQHQLGVAFHNLLSADIEKYRSGALPCSFRWPLPNVWLGVSVEDQKWADIRVPALLGTPAAVRFLSCEPLLGPVNLSAPRVLAPAHIRGIHWVIAGGESGAGARPMHPDWARGLRDECQAAGVPFFFKQWGSHRWVAGDRYDEATQCWVDHGIVPQRVSKKLAGRILDGREWSEFPAAAVTPAAAL